MGRFWDGHRLLIGIEEVENFHAGIARFLVKKEKTGQVQQDGRSRRRESGLQVPGSLL